MHQRGKLETNFRVHKKRKRNAQQKRLNRGSIVRSNDLKDGVMSGLKQEDGTKNSKDQEGRVALQLKMHLLNLLLVKEMKLRRHKESIYCSS